MITLTLTDQIPSGKNQVKEDWVGGMKRRHGNKRFAMWRETAGKEIMMQKRFWPLALKMLLPLAGDLVVTISYRPLDKTQRDLPGMQDALFHLLEYMELIENDGQIKGLTWRYPWRTKGPCVEMEIRNG